MRVCSDGTWQIRGSTTPSAPPGEAFSFSFRKPSGSSELTLHFLDSGEPFLNFKDGLLLWRPYFDDDCRGFFHFALPPRQPAYSATFSRQLH